MSALPQPSFDVAPGFRRFRIGDVGVTALFDGYTPRAVDANWVVNAQLEDVQATLRAVGLPTDIVPTHFTALLLDIGGRRILIDAGFGDSGPPTAGALVANMKASGIDPAEIDLVLISHFHGDHINGLRSKDGDLFFPNAEIAVPAVEWDFWMDDARMSAAPDAARASFTAARRIFGPIAKDIRKFDPTADVAPGVKAMPTPGHSPGHTSFMIASAGARLLAVGDAVNNPRIFARRPDYQLGFDMNKPLAVETRGKLLAMAAAERLQLSFYHAAFPATGFVSTKDGAYDWSPIAFDD